MKNIIFTCRKDNSILEIVKGFYSPFYCCPKYYVRNRKYGESGCSNRISIKNIRSLRDYISVKDISDELYNGQEFFYNNYSVKIEIITEAEINVSILKEEDLKHENDI